MNNLTGIDTEAQFNELAKPTLSIQRKYLQKIEKDIGIRKWSKAVSNDRKPAQHNFKQSFLEEPADVSEVEVKVTSINQENLLSAKKTVDLFAKARDALSKPASAKYTNELLGHGQKEARKAREIQPMQKRKGLWQQPSEEKTVELSTSPNAKDASEIPFSKNRFSKEGTSTDLFLENKKKAIKFLK